MIYAWYSASESLATAFLLRACSRLREAMGLFFPAHLPGVESGVGGSAEEPAAAFFTGEGAFFFSRTTRFFSQRPRGTSRTLRPTGTGTGHAYREKWGWW